MDDENKEKEKEIKSDSDKVNNPEIKKKDEKSSESISIKIKKDDIWKYATFILFVILIVGGIIFIPDRNGGGIVDVNGVEPTPIPPIPQPPVVKASIDDDAVLGDKNAPVTIIEFSDYSCSFCARFWADTLPSIKSEYIEKGKVKLVYRDYPFLGPVSVSAAEATECVREQGGDDAFWKYHDTIFENQQQLSEGKLLEWAQEMSYDIEECLESGKFTSEVQKDLADGQAAGVRGTPGFVINGQLVSGAQPFAVFKQVIDEDLAS